MKIIPHLISMFLSLCLLNSCNESAEKNTAPLEDDYDQRMANTNKLLKDYQIDLNGDSATVYIIQVEKCSMCNETSLANIKSDAQKDLTKKVFIMSDTNSSVQSYIQQEICIEKKMYHYY